MAARRVTFAVVIALAIFHAGCSRPSSNAAHLSASAAPLVLSATAAAELAARLANEQCERQFRKRPFAAGQHIAALKEGVYHWGGLDVGGVGGFSALVTFAPDATHPHVEVYFSSDALAANHR